jgi:hypothetical protein
VQQQLKLDLRVEWPHRLHCATDSSNRGTFVEKKQTTRIRMNDFNSATSSTEGADAWIGVLLACARTLMD